MKIFGDGVSIDVCAGAPVLVAAHSSLKFNSLLKNVIEAADARLKWARNEFTQSLSLREPCNLRPFLRRSGNTDSFSTSC
jgi:hypothetical protein